MSNLLKVLLIENNKLDYYTFVHAMSKIDYTLMYGKVDSGQQALTLLKNCTKLPDVIVSDIDPACDEGSIYLRKLLRKARTMHIPVVILCADLAKSGYSKRIGATGFVKKPECCTQLKERLEHVFDSGIIANVRKRLELV